VFRFLRRRLWLRLPHRPVNDLVVPDALTPLVDDCERRLTRAPETPRRLSISADYGARTLYGRFPR
jgi:hypothetical protein